MLITKMWTAELETYFRKNKIENWQAPKYFDWSLYCDIEGLRRLEE